MPESTTITRVTASIAGPLPASGVMSMSDGAKLRVEIDLDLSPLITRAVMTHQVPDLGGAVREALTALLADLAPKFAAAQARRGRTGKKLH